jgi:hypothetical protein
MIAAMLTLVVAALLMVVALMFARPNAAKCARCSEAKVEVRWRSDLVVPRSDHWDGPWRLAA